MKINDNYKVRKVAGENLVIRQGTGHSDMTRIISLNSPALFLWEKLSGRVFSAEEASELLVGEYGIEKEQALSDVREWIRKMVSAGVME